MTVVNKKNIFVNKYEHNQDCDPVQTDMEVINLFLIFLKKVGCKLHVSRTLITTY